MEYSASDLGTLPSYFSIQEKSTSNIRTIYLIKHYLWLVLSLESSDKEEHYLKELEQEKLILEDCLEILSSKDTISQEIFDSMSHELRTPIVSIKAYTDMLIDGRFGKLSEKQEKKLIQIKTNTNLLLDVVFKMLEKSHSTK